MSTTPSRAAKARGIRGRHVLGAMLAFFAVIVVADATMIYKALTTFGGVDNSNAYREGLAYNERIARDARPSAARLARTRSSPLAAPQRLRVSTARPRRRRSCRQKRRGDARTPSDQPLRRRRSSSPRLRPGLRGAAAPAPAEGTWIVDRPRNPSDGDIDEPVYQTRRRLWVAP